MALYPNVPDVPGVPPLPRSPIAAAQQVFALISDVTGLPIMDGNPIWGLFKDGQSVIDADSVASFEYRQDWAIADFPVEEGGFETYDKVNSPFAVRFVFAKGGTETERSIFLQQIEAASDTTDVFDGVTPEKTYSNLNVTHYDFRRTSRNGVTLLLVDVWCLEVRQNATAEFTQTKSPSGSDPQNSGTVQTKQPTDNQSALSSLLG